MKTKQNERDIIRTRQRAWATRNGRVIDVDGYCLCVDDNIFRGLSPTARKDFEKRGRSRTRKGRRTRETSSAPFIVGARVQLV